MFTSVFRAARLLPVCLLVLTAPATAQPRLNLAVLIDEVLRASTAVRAAGQRTLAASARIEQVRVRPDPMLSGGYRSVGSPLPGAGLRTEPLASFSVMASQAIPLPRRRALEATAAINDRDAERPRADVLRLATISRVRQAYYRLARVYAESDVVARNVDLLDTLLRVSEGRYAVGKAAQQDVIKAQTELSILELQQRRLAQERLTLEAELNLLRGMPPDASLGRPDDLTFLTLDRPLESLLEEARHQAPVLQRDRTLIARAETGLALARLTGRPDITVSGGYSYSGAMPSMFEARIDVSVPLGQTRRRAAVAEQSSLLAAARADVAADTQQLDIQIAQQFRAASTATELARLYRDAVLPQARLALESSITSYESGSVDFLSVLTNFAAVLHYETSHVGEVMNIHMATSQVEELTGAALPH